MLTLHSREKQKGKVVRLGESSAVVGRNKETYIVLTSSSGQKGAG